MDKAWERYAIEVDRRAGYRKLALAILEQSWKEWKRYSTYDQAMTAREFKRRMEECEGKYSGDPRNIAHYWPPIAWPRLLGFPCYRDELAAFFLSDWCRDLCDVVELDHSMMIETIGLNGC